MILARWIWQPNEQLLLVLYFLDDYSKPNLRGKIDSVANIKLGYLDNQHQINERMYFVSMELKPIFSWAPSHIEQGLIAELLSFANRINGNKGRFKLHDWLKEHIVLKGLDQIVESHLHFTALIKGGFVFGRDELGLYTAFSISEEYINWLRSFEE